MWSVLKLMELQGQRAVDDLFSTAVVGRDGRTLPRLFPGTSHRLAGGERLPAVADGMAGPRGLSAKRGTGAAPRESLSTLQPVEYGHGVLDAPELR